MSNFIKQQPKRGDVIMHCGHCDRGSMHWFQYDKPIRFQRLDGSRGQATWFAACQPCVIKHGDKVVNYVRGDGVWSGDAPVIERTDA